MALEYAHVRRISRREEAEQRAGPTARSLRVPPQILRQQAVQRRSGRSELMTELLQEEQVGDGFDDKLGGYHSPVPVELHQRMLDGRTDRLPLGISFPGGPLPGTEGPLRERQP